MIPEVEGIRPWGSSRKRVPKRIKGPKTTYTTIAVAEKQSKRSKKGPFSLYIGSPGPTQEMELMGPGGEGPSRSAPVSPAMVTMRTEKTLYTDTDTDTDNVFRPSMAWVLWCLRHYNSQTNTVLKMGKTQRETKK